jgi:hypothetical protein
MGQFFTTSRYHRKGLDLVPDIKVQLYVNACTFKKNILSQDCNAAVIYIPFGCDTTTLHDFVFSNFK